MQQTMTTKTDFLCLIRIYQSSHSLRDIILTQENTVAIYQTRNITSKLNEVNEKNQLKLEMKKTKKRN